LGALGLTKAQFAERYGVNKSAVSQWVVVPAKAEAFLVELEGGGGPQNGDDVEHAKEVVLIDTHIAVGNLVKTDTNETCIVVRRDRCESINGGISWIYWICAAQEEKGAWKRTGVTTRIPEKFLTDLGPVELKPFQTEAQEKGK
jgi:hypothetical protein